MDKINKKRRELLLKIDNNEVVDQNALVMYGLTSYVQEEVNTGMSLIDYRLKNHTISRQLHHNPDISLMPEQQNALNLLDSGSRILFMAPTSFGKSLIVKEYIWINKPQNVVYIVPTNSLALELERSYKKVFSGKYEIFDSSINYKTNLSHNLLFVGTQEKYIKLRDQFKQVDLMIIDEAYKLKDELTDERCMALSKVLLEDALEKSNKVILLLPNANVRGISEFDFKIVEKRFNAVDKKLEIYHDFNAYINNLLLDKRKSIVYFATPSAMKVAVKKLPEKASVKDTKFMKHLKEETCYKKSSK